MNNTSKQTFDASIYGWEIPSGKPTYPQWIVDAHKVKKPRFETRTCANDDWGYQSDCHPYQVVICAAGWPAKLLTWIFRIKPCYYTGTKEYCWPKPDLL